MIAQLRGTIVELGESGVILDVAGVGYAITVSGKTQARLGLADPAVTLLTEMIVREDSMTLFGFLEPAERDAFRLLTSVQGVGAKAAMAILSVLTPAELASAIMASDKAMV
ncbi:MAG: Holliday junction branch migration protein RuvA, partial [Alphaproteobacteria bacterium]